MGFDIPARRSVRIEADRPKVRQQLNSLIECTKMRQVRGVLQAARVLIAEGQPLVLIAQSTIQLNGALLVGARQTT